MKKLRSNPSRLGTPGERVTRTASWREGQGSSTARGYNYEWQKARADYLLANPFCVECRKRGIYRASCVVDHVKPHHGDPVLFWDRTNWQALCVTCHNAHKQRQERAHAMGSKLSTNMPRARQSLAHEAPGTDDQLTIGEGGVKVPPPVDT